MNEFSTHPLYGKHNLDSAMSSLWRFYTKKLISLFILSFAMSLVVQIISSNLKFTEVQTISDPTEMLDMLKSMIWPIILISLISLFFTVILSYYIIYNPVDEDKNILTCIVNSLKYYIPYLIIVVIFAFLASFALLLGLLALIVGVFFAALYVGMIYLFILPVLLAEGTNIGHVINRTVILAHRNFWSNMGWVAVFVLILMVISIVTSALLLLPFTGSFIKVMTNPTEAEHLVQITTSPVYIVLSSLISAFYFPLMPILGVILYFNGRAREEEVTDNTPADDQDNNRLKIEDLYANPDAGDNTDDQDNSES